MFSVGRASDRVPKLQTKYPMQIPGHVLGCDLIWWRESDSLHTAVTIWGGLTDLRALGLHTSEEGEILFQLHDPAGRLLSNWTERILPGIPITLNSKNRPDV